jgi:hypothetical protein
MKTGKSKEHDSLKYIDLEIPFVKREILKRYGRK